MPVAASGTPRHGNAASSGPVDLGLGLRRLLVLSKHRSLLRRIQLEIDDIRCLLLEIRVEGRFVIFNSVWL